MHHLQVVCAVPNETKQMCVNVYVPVSPFAIKSEKFKVNEEREI